MKVSIKRKLLTLLMVIALLAAAIPFTSLEVHADVTSGTSSITGKLCTSDSYAASTIDYLIKKYPQGAKWTSSGQCYGYAEKISTSLASSRKTSSYKSLKFNKKNFRSKCLNVKAGTHLRLSHSKTFNGGYGHSIVLLKVTDKLVVWADNNYIGSNIIGYRTGTLQDFVDYYSQYEYLNRVTKPTKYKKSSTPSVAARANSKGGVDIAWTKTTGTSKYYVYRASNKNGKYKKIKSTTSRKYTDTKSSLGKKYYYKVKSVRKAGSKKSNITSSTRRLAKPSVSVSINADGKPYIKWKKVSGATGYKVYVYDDWTGKYKKIKTISGGNTLNYTYSKAKAGDYSGYCVKAIYSKNTKGNSSYSSLKYVETLPLTPGISGTTDDLGNIIITISKQSDVDSYDIYRKGPDDSEFKWYDSFSTKDGLAYTDEQYWLTPGSTYEYYVVACYDYWTESKPSNVITVSAPVLPETSTEE